jgi:hypothetical protein
MDCDVVVLPLNTTAPAKFGKKHNLQSWDSDDVLLAHV